MGDFVIKLLDVIFKDASGKLILWRLITTIIVLLGIGGWYARTELLNAYKETRYDAYLQVQEKERIEKFDKAVKEQLQIVHISSGAEFSGITEFRPKNKNFFFDLIAYEGTLPEELNPRNLGGYPVDKTSEEYILHSNGKYYTSTETFRLPTKSKIEGKYLLSCPYFNLDNGYAGSIFMMFNGKPVIDDDRLNMICSQASRALGRTK